MTRIYHTACRWQAAARARPSGTLIFAGGENANESLHIHHEKSHICQVDKCGFFRTKCSASAEREVCFASEAHCVREACLRHDRWRNASLHIVRSTILRGGSAAASLDETYQTSQCPQIIISHFASAKYFTKSFSLLSHSHCSTMIISPVDSSRKRHRRRSPSDFPLPR